MEFPYSVHPVGMESSFLINAFIRVGTETVTLCLKKIRASPCSTVRVKVSKRAGESGNSRASFHRQGNNAPPARAGALKNWG